MSTIGAIFRRDGAGIDLSQTERLSRALNAPHIEHMRTFSRGRVGLVCGSQCFTPEDRFERQPIAVGERYWLVWDGRIDNRDDLAEALGLSHADVKTMADGLMFAKSFKRWDLEALNRIVGVFSIIIYDREREELIIARDHFGQRPLFYWSDQKQVVISSEIRGLFALPQIPRELNEEYMAFFLAGEMPNELPCFRGIVSVPPAHICRFGRNDSQTTEYWSFDHEQKPTYSSADDYVDGLRHFLNLAVHAQMRHCKRLGANLSGGLDSTAIAATAAIRLAHSGLELHTFTHVPEAGFVMPETGGRFFDEEPYARAVAERFENIVPHFIDSSAQRLSEQLTELTDIYDDPAANIVNLLWHHDILRKAGSSGVDVLLNGEAGNLVFSYNGLSHLHDLVRYWRLGELWRTLRAFPAHQHRTILRQFVLAPLVPPPLFRAYKRWRHGPEPYWRETSLASKALLRAYNVEERLAKAQKDYDGQRSANSLHWRRQIIMETSENASGWAAQRKTFGIDCRSPALDRRLVNFGLNVPDELWLRDGTTRWLLREAMRDRLPEIVRTNRKLGIQAADWHRRLSRETAQFEALAAKLIADSETKEWIDHTKLKAALAQWPIECPMPWTSQADLLRATIPAAFALGQFVRHFHRKNE